ncbi:MAG: N-6 DNA methylase [Halobacteriota archaeon]
MYVIEAKAKRENIADAISDAEGRLAEINRSNVIKVVMISGVAGNDSEGYVVKSKFLADGMLEPVTINGQDVSSLISPEIAKTLLSTNQSNIEDLPIDEKFFISKAEEINKVLHLGAINKTLRARVIAALLLSLVEDTPPNLDAPPSILIAEINARVKRVLTNEGKPEFYRCIEISAPTSEANHNKFKIALVRTLQELQNLNIRSAMSSGTDVLGKFYEVFLKYGNGAKEIGIVLTPRHLTKFVADVSNITPRDIVLDPACGTGGFLVSAFDKIQKETSEEQINAFKQNSLFGIEQESEVVR